MRVRRVVAGTIAGVTAAAAVVSVGASASVQGNWRSTATRAVHFAHASTLGPAPATAPLHLALGLAPRDLDAANAALKAIMTPGSASYHHYLTVAEYVARYAPTAGQVEAVTSYLERSGFMHVTVQPNRLLITADGTVAQAQRAFHTRLASFRIGNRTFIGNTVAAQVPATLSVVQSVIGLNTLPLPMPHPLRHAASHAAATGSPDPFIELPPKDFRNTYDAGHTPTGARTSIALLTEGKIDQVVKDLRTAETRQHLPKVPVTEIKVGPQSNDTSGQDEFDMDTQVSTAMATTVKHLYLYNIASLVDSNIVTDFAAFAGQRKAQAMSASIGGCDIGPYLDGSMLTTDVLMQEAAMQGQTLFASSGDNGAGCAFVAATGVPSSFPGTNWPASGEFTTAVGGTSLLTDADGNRVQEVGWVGSGGGTSEVSAPGWWQAPVNPAQDAEFVTGGRAVPDISLDADPNFFTAALVYVDSKPTGVGGTSLSSPLMLGAWARLESAHHNDLGMAAIDLYGVYDKANPGTSVAGLDTLPAVPPAAVKGFTDIIVGDNGPYAAAPGYDEVTGLGAPDIAALAKQLR